MRIRSRRNPKHMSLTPEQEAEYENYERDMASAQILGMGVAAFLNRADSYSTQIECEEAARILNTAVETRKRASEGREAIRKTAEDAEANPVPKKRTRKAKQ